jgi:heat shock protein HslJ
MKFFTIVFLLLTALFFNACSSSKGVGSKEIDNLTSSTARGIENIYWKLTLLNSKEIPSVKKGRREAHIILSNGKVKGNSGCNGFGASYILDNDKVSFDTNGFMMTRMFCKDSVENEFLKMIPKVVSYKIKGESLEFFDKDGSDLAKFESVYLY